MPIWWICENERNTRPILNLFFYLKRRNLSLDNRKRITTIYVTVWKLFTYTGLELSGSDHNRILIYEKKKKRWVSLWDRGAQGTEYHQDGFLWHLYGFYDVTSCYLCNSIQIFPNADLMDMRKFYILNGILNRFLICFFI